MCHLLLIIPIIFLAGCASTFKVSSDPLQADVLVVNEKTGEKKPLGKTPIELPHRTVKEAIGEEVTSGDYFLLFVEKDGYLPEKLLVPTTRFGTLVTNIAVKLKEGNAEKEERTAKEVLDKLFLAQNFAKTREFERAQIELDKVLTLAPLLPQALSMRASIYFMQKNYPESLKWYEKALAVNPQMESAIKMTNKIHTLQNGGNPKAPNSNSPAKLNPEVKQSGSQ